MAESAAEKKARLEREKKKSLGEKVGGGVSESLKERKKRRQALLASLD